MNVTFNINMTINLSAKRTLIDTIKIEEPRLAMLAGRPGMGKTAFALTLSKECQDEGVPVLYYSLKNSRLHLRTDRLERMGIEPNNKNITIIDRKDLTAKQFEELLMNTKSDNQYKFIVVDYLQLLQIGWMIDDLRNIAYRHDCFVLALAYLPRQIEMRADRHPVLEDIGHSEFDDVYFIYRDDYYQWDEEPWQDYINERLNPEPEEDTVTEAELIIAKSMLLETGTVPLLYDHEKIMFNLK